MNTICIMCPMGCPIEVTECDGKITVTGNTCKRGESYGITEYSSPMRIVTTLVRLNTGGVVSVKTDKPVKKSEIAKVIAAAASVKLIPPLSIGDIAVENVDGEGANLIVTTSIPAYL